MPELERLSFTIEKPLLRRMNRLMRKTGHGNRSEFIRDLLRKRLVEEDWIADEDALGTITLVYIHGQRQLSQNLTATQHHHHKLVLATTHVHLDRDTCAEMIMVRGRAKAIEALTDALQREKGVLHASLSMSSAGRRLRG